VSIPRKVLQGPIEWYKTLGAAADFDETQANLIFYFGVAPAGCNIECVGEVEFANPLPASLVPPEMREKLRKDRLAQVLKLRADALKLQLAGGGTTASEPAPDVKERAQVSGKVIISRTC